MMMIKLSLLKNSLKGFEAWKLMLI